MVERILMTREEVAEALGVTPRFVRDLAARGEIKELRLGYKTVRFDKRDVNAYVRRLRRRA